MNKAISLFPLFLLLFSASYAQSSTVTGKVLDSSGEPMPFANVLLFSSIDSSLVKAGFSSDDGSFNLSPVPVGNYSLEVRMSGLKTYRSEELKVDQGKNIDLETILLLELETELEAVQITGEKPLVTVKPDMTVFNVEGTINAIGENAFDLLRKAPGVMIDNSDNIMLLGNAGTRIFIDGKPSPLTSSDLSAFLRGVQSSEIESIEIIANPSSKYDAEGNAGIINIKMKRDKNLGANGNISLGSALGFVPEKELVTDPEGSTGLFPKLNGSASFNYRNKAVNAFASYSASAGKSRSWMDLYRVQDDTVSLIGTDPRRIIYDQKTASRDTFFNQNFKLGADFFIGKEHTIGVMASGYLADRNSSTFSKTPIVDSVPMDTLAWLVSENNSNRKTTNLDFNLNYRFDQGNGNTLSLDADYGYYRLLTDSKQPNTYLGPNGEDVLYPRNFQSITPTDIGIWTFKADHERNLLGGKFAAGLKFSYVNTDNTFDFKDLGTAKGDTLNLNRSNNYVYSENVNAAYFNYQKKVKKWAFQVGLRAENTNWQGILTSEVNNANRDSSYFSFFPSGGITFSPNQKNSLRLTYSRRIDRPRYQDLNEFEYTLDELTFSRGNPFLQPQFTNKFQLSHTYNYVLNTSLSYRVTTGYFTDITDTIGARSYITKLNLGTQTGITLNAGAPYQIAKWWSTYTNGSVYNTRNQADFGDGKQIDINRYTFSVYHQSTFKLPLDFSLQVSGHYTSPSIWGANYKNRRFWAVDAGLQKKLWNGRGNLRLSMSDIFYSMKWQGVQNYGGLYMIASGGWDSRQFKVNFSYTLGNTQVKEARKRKTGLEDEKNRVKGS